MMNSVIQRELRGLLEQFRVGLVLGQWRIQCDVDAAQVVDELGQLRHTDADVVLRRDAQRLQDDGADECRAPPG